MKTLSLYLRALAKWAKRHWLEALLLGFGFMFWAVDLTFRQ